MTARVVIGWMFKFVRPQIAGRMIAGQARYLPFSNHRFDGPRVGASLG